MVEKFGGIDLNEIAQAAKEQPFPDNAGATPVARFLWKVSALITLRQEQGEKGGVSVFLLSDAVIADAERAEVQSENSLVANGNDPITNKVWLSNATLGRAFVLDVDCVEHSRIFQRVQEIGFGGLPALFLDWRGEVPMGRFYSLGFDDPEHVEEIVLAYEAISEDNLKQCLDRFYDTALRTPQRTREGHGAAVWENASKGWPANRPEERIHSKLIEQLRSRYTKHNVRSEVHNEDGITDLVIYANATDNAGQKIVIKEWVLELKVLTEHTITGNPIGLSEVRKRTQEGLTQAIAYRNREHARQAALCCYDMRGNDEGDDACFSEVAAEASDELVKLWRWLLLRSSSAGRNADRSERIALNSP